MYKKGYTLAEVLIVLGILGLIAAMTLSIVFKVLPNKDEENWKKTAYIIQNIITIMHNDETMYPKLDDYTKKGFKNTEKVTIKGVQYGGNSSDGENETKLREQKFCKLFGARFEKKLKRDDQVSCLNPSISGGNILDLDPIPAFRSTNKISFTTTDNMDWFLFKDDFHRGYSLIIVDINGSECPNTTDLSQPADRCNGRYKMADRRVFYIRSNGTFTNTHPSKDDSEYTPYSIQVTIECNDRKPDCGTVTIDRGEEDPESNTFYDLKLNEKYTLTAKSKMEGSEELYTSNWTDNKKEITVDGRLQVIKTTVRFSPVEKHYIKLNIEGCTESGNNPILTKCLDSSNFTLKKYAKWQEDANDNNGLTPNQGSVNNSVIKSYNSGKFNENDDGTLISNQTFPIGNYKLKFKLQDPYAVYSPKNYKITTTFEKDFRLGTQDFVYTVKIMKCDKIQVQKNGEGNAIDLKICEPGGSGYDSSDNEYTPDGTNYKYNNEIYERVP